MLNGKLGIFKDYLTFIITNKALNKIFARKGGGHEAFRTLDEGRETRKGKHH
jgi:hypothetical protein